MSLFIAIVGFWLGGLTVFTVKLVKAFKDLKSKILEESDIYDRAS